MNTLEKKVFVIIFWGFLMAITATSYDSVKADVITANTVEQENISDDQMTTIYEAESTVLEVITSKQEETVSENATYSQEKTTTSPKEVKDGFVTMNNGKKRYYVDGVYYTGFLTIKQNNYFFDKKGYMTVGLKKIKKHYYYFNRKGIMQTGLQSIKGKQYFFDYDGRGIEKGWNECCDENIRYGLGKGRIATGKRKIGKNIYFFNTKQGTRHRKGFIEYKDKTYYCKGHGELAVGFKAIQTDKGLYGYYFSKKTGAMVKNKTIGHLKIPKSGRLSEAYALGIKTLDKIGWNLYKAFYYSSHLTYYDRWYRTTSSERYALRGFKYGYGNCYVMAATFYIQAKLLGYDVHQISGYVGTAPHSWVVIKHPNVTYVYDTNFTNETGRNGWKIYYGKPGTWRYRAYHYMN